MNKGKVTINDIFRMYAGQYLIKFQNSIHPVQRKAINDIITCRTSAQGGRVVECDCCGTNFILYNSCKNRHCPQCQNLEREKWLLARKNNILPVKYFHIIFTIPDKLNSLIYSNQKLLLNLFFKSAADSLIELGMDTKFLGALIGITAILHTWGQNLLYHPHIHLLVPAGGLNSLNSEWIDCKRKNFFIPVEVISDLFKKKFLANLNKIYFNNFDSLSFAYNSSLKNISYWKYFVNSLYSQNWVVFATKPYKKPESVIDYFGRYSHKIAITNYRIIKLENHFVYFKYKDYRTGKSKPMKLPALEFIRRFLLHILPSRFTKIRHYGIFANTVVKKNVEFIRSFLNARISLFSEIYSAVKDNTQLALALFSNIVINKCPVCQNGRLITKRVFRKGLSPPVL